METPASFRKDLKLYLGPKEPDGSPTYNLYDPLNAKYYKLGWAESIIYKLAKEGISFAMIAKEVEKHSTFDFSEEDVGLFFTQAARLGLLDLPKSASDVMEEFQKNKGNLLWWTIMHYLYFRIPLFKPAHFLQITLPYVKKLWSNMALIIYLLATIFGLLAVLSRSSEYFHTFSYFFNFEGVIMYGLTICALKIIHELAHAYTATNYHIHVPSMGAAIIVLWPVLYTDVTDSWKLANRKERLAISIAGVISELVIAGLSTFGWAISPPGILQSIFFLLSSTTWISSLFINFNPAMRFDGYYILSDLWGVDNLRQRSFAVAQWKIHEWLFGFNLPCPEENISQKRILAMLAYSLFTWSYLLILYTVIALFVYYEFAKALGIILFFLEVAIFFIWPVVDEAKALYRRRSYFQLNFRTLITFLSFGLVCVWLIFPFAHKETAPAITLAEVEQVLYLTEPGKIHDIFFKQGDLVLKGQTILQLQEQKIQSEIADKKESKKFLERMIQISSIEQERQSLIPAQKIELLSLIDQLEALEAKQEYLDIKAEISGKLFTFDDSLKVGQTLAKNQILGKIADIEKMNVIAFIPERLIQTLHLNQQVEFILPNDSLKISGFVTNIELSPVSILEYPSLSSKFKGPLAVTVDHTNNNLKLIDSYYKARIILQEPAKIPLGKIGNIRWTKDQESLLMRLLRFLHAIFIQESAL